MCCRSGCTEHFVHTAGYFEHGLSTDNNRTPGCRTASHISCHTAEVERLNKRVARYQELPEPEAKKLAFSTSDTRVYADHDTTERRGVIPVELSLPTTAQPSGCVVFHNKGRLTQEAHRQKSPPKKAVMTVNPP